MGKYFGTDGVRGEANVELTPELAFKLGRFGDYVLSQHESDWIMVSSFLVVTAINWMMIEN